MCCLLSPTCFHIPRSTNIFLSTKYPTPILLDTHVVCRTAIGQNIPSVRLCLVKPQKVTKGSISLYLLVHIVDQHTSHPSQVSHMADKNNSTVHVWESSTTIELLALLLTIPGAMAAIATFYVLVTRHRQKKLSTSSSILCYSVHCTHTCAEKLKRSHTV
jgi:hypothetical protein